MSFSHPFEAVPFTWSNITYLDQALPIWSQTYSEQYHLFEASPTHMELCQLFRTRPYFWSCLHAAEIHVLKNEVKILKEKKE